MAGQRVLDARLDRGGGIAFASLVGICAEPTSTAYGGGYRLEVGAGDLERAAALGAFGIAGYQGGLLGEYHRYVRLLALVVHANR